MTPYALIDANNFYVSCERVFDYHLRDRPVVVLSNNYSIDESFLRFTPGEAAGLTALGGKLWARVLQWTGLPVGVGIGPTKTLANLANHLAKLHRYRTGGPWAEGCPGLVRGGLSDPRRSGLTPP